MTKQGNALLGEKPPEESKSSLDSRRRKSLISQRVPVVNAEDRERNGRKRKGEAIRKTSPALQTGQVTVKKPSL